VSLLDLTQLAGGALVQCRTTTIVEAEGILEQELARLDDWHRRRTARRRAVA